MSDSWRLTVREIDVSQTVIPTVGTTGAMVIRASRGPVKPVLISARNQERILRLYGKPSATYPDVWEAIEYNKIAPIWISAPYTSTDTLGGVIIKATGAEALSETGGLTPDSLDTYSFDSSDEYALLLSKSPTADFLGVKLSKNTSTGFFTLELYETKDDGSTFTLIDTYTVSFTEGQKDGFGKNIYIEEVLENNDYVQVLVNDNRSVTTYSDDSEVVAFDGGDRSGTLTVSEITTAWDYFQKKRTYPADIFMDTTTEADVVDKFDTLRSSYQKYAYYILPLPIGEDESTAISTKEGLSVNNAGLAFYWNHGRVRDSISGTSFWTSLIGRIGAKFAAQADVFNASQHAWIDENNHGGQLGTGIIELEYDPTETELEQLDNAGINPIIFDQSYGVLIASQRTAQSPDNLSDTSWIPHRRLFDYLISNIINQVLVYQIVKLNDELHRQLAFSKTRTIVEPVVDAGFLSEAAIQCDRGNNTDEVLAQRKFVLTVAVKVTPFSETITFNFVYVAQTNSVDSVIQ